MSQNLQALISATNINNKEATN